MRTCCCGQHIGLSIETLAVLKTEEQKRAMEDAAVREFFASIVNEVDEEINLPEADLTPPLLLGVVLQSDACTPSFCTREGERES